MEESQSRGEGEKNRNHAHRETPVFGDPDELAPSPTFGRRTNDQRGPGTCWVKRLRNRGTNVHVMVRIEAGGSQSNHLATRTEAGKRGARHIEPGGILKRRKLAPTHGSKSSLKPASNGFYFSYFWQRFSLRTLVKRAGKLGHKTVRTYGLARVGARICTASAARNPSSRTRQKGRFSQMFGFIIQSWKGKEKNDILVATPARRLRAGPAVRPFN